jgi:SAM-dependent methyltransferase
VSADRAEPVSERPGTRRSLRLFRAFRSEQRDPESFYRLLAADSVSQLAGHVSLGGGLVLDIGGGMGYFTDAFRQAGASCFLVEPDLPGVAGGTGGTDARSVGRPHQVAIAPGRKVPSGTVVADGYRLPFRDGAADVCFSSNVLEHVKEPFRILSEMVRVTRQGGVVYVAFTNWLSPWGGHETSPWHFLGGRRAGRHYEKATGFPPIHVFGQNLFAVHVGRTLRAVRRWPAVEVLEATPRYHPWWLAWVVRVPVLREVATWNLLLVLRRRGGAEAGPADQGDVLSPLPP